MRTSVTLADKKIPKFEGVDYDAWPGWKREFLATATIHKIIMVIKSGRPADDDFAGEADEAARRALVADLRQRQREWDERNEMLSAWLVLSLGVVPQQHIAIHGANGRAAWLALVEKYENLGDPTKVARLNDRLRNMRLKEREDPDAYFGRLDEIMMTLKDAGEPVRESMLIGMIQDQLPRTYDGLFANLATSDVHDYDTLRAAVVRYYHRVIMKTKPHKPVSPMEERALMSMQPRCTTCFSVFHMAPDCPDKHRAGLQGRPDRGRGRGRGGGRDGGGRGGRGGDGGRGHDGGRGGRGGRGGAKDKAHVDCFGCGGKGHYSFEKACPKHPQHQAAHISMQQAVEQQQTARLAVQPAQGGTAMVLMAVQEQQPADDHGVFYSISGEDLMRIHQQTPACLWSNEAGSDDHLRAFMGEVKYRGLLQLRAAQKAQEHAEAVAHLEMRTHDLRLPHEMYDVEWARANHATLHRHFPRHTPPEVILAEKIWRVKWLDY